MELRSEMVNQPVLCFNRSYALNENKKTCLTCDLPETQGKPKVKFSRLNRRRERQDRMAISRGGKRMLTLFVVAAAGKSKYYSATFSTKGSWYNLASQGR